MPSQRGLRGKKYKHTNMYLPTYLPTSDDQCGQEEGREEHEPLARVRWWRHRSFVLTWVDDVYVSFISRLACEEHERPCLLPGDESSTLPPTPSTGREAA